MQHDQRNWPREQMTHPAKAHRLTTGKYLAGRTVNISAGGVLLELDEPARVEPGETLRLGIAFANEPVLRRSRMSEATVVRSMGFGGRQHVAVKYVQPQALPARRAAG